LSVSIWDVWQEVSLAKKKKKQRKPPQGDSRSPSIGELLVFSARVFSDRTAAKIEGAGHQGVRASHLAVARHMDADGTRISELARRAGMTKQAMGQLVRELEQRRYVELWQDPTDRRAKLVTYTEAGQRLALDVARAVGEVHSEFKDALGKGGAKELRRLLNKVAGELTAS
jgi:DNA-binding MarR family transcriptional regulator